MEKLACLVKLVRVSLYFYGNKPANRGGGDNVNCSGRKS